MGTNYYLMNGDHIGKESAAGLYCWDCKISLCTEGEDMVHHRVSWHDECPECNKAPNKSSPSAAARQLGFLDEEDKPIKKGVSSISSFTWAIEPQRLKGKRKIRDEYDRVITKEKFDAILSNWCAIQRYDLIGRDFS